MPTYVIEFINAPSEETEYEEVESDTEHNARMSLIAKYAPRKIEIAGSWPKDIDQPG